MRTIRFRGKRISGGRWVYGNSLIQWNSGIAITNNIAESKLNGKNTIEVATQTIGQFTGLYDRNGEEIYEGDILRISDFANVVCEFRHGTFGYMYCNDFHSFAGNTNYTFNPKNTDDDFEIIGNVYDNPELLKGGEK